MIVKILPTSSSFSLPAVQSFWQKYQVMEISAALLKNLEQIKKVSALVSIVCLVIGIAYVFLSLSVEKKEIASHLYQPIAYPRGSFRDLSMEEMSKQAEESLQKALWQH